MSAIDLIEIVNPGLGASVQDLGRPGWKRFGVPKSGAMDPHAATWANRLVGNAPDAPVIEFLLQGGEVRVLADCRLAVAGADAADEWSDWHAAEVRAGDRISFSQARNGVWLYLAVAGGFDAQRALGSASAYPRGGFGRAFAAGDRIGRDRVPARRDAALAGAWTAVEERRDYRRPPALKVWRGPQWEDFDAGARQAFFDASWNVSSRSDRTGYRLDGLRLEAPKREMQSEPVLVGSIQVPPDGRPIVIMPDGPTVGGYPKLALVDEDSLSWLAQCGPGVPFRWELAE